MTENNDIQDPHSALTEEKWWLMRFLLKIVLVIVIITVLVGVAHLIYREIKIQDCGCNTIFETIDCQENDWKCQKDIEQSLKEAKDECRRESIDCRFLFDCVCK